MSDREPKLERARLHAVVLILVSAPVVVFTWAVGYARRVRCSGQI